MRARTYSTINQAVETPSANGTEERRSPAGPVHRTASSLGSISSGVYLVFGAAYLSNL
jgi:hypothetical protein